LPPRSRNEGTGIPPATETRTGTADTRPHRESGAGTRWSCEGSPVEPHLNSSGVKRISMSRPMRARRPVCLSPSWRASRHTSRPPTARSTQSRC